MSPAVTSQKVRGTYSSPRQEERQKRILEVARRELAAVGYDEITMQRLAEAAEVSTKTLYNLYGSKDELLLSSVENLLQQLQEASSSRGGREGVEALMALCEVSAQQVVATPHYSEVLAKALFGADKEHRLTRILLGDTLQQAEQAFAASQQQGEIDAEADVKALAKLFTAHQWGLILAWDKGLIPLADYPEVALRSQLTTILPVCQGRLRKWLIAKAASANIPL